MAVDSPEGRWQVAIARSLGGSQWRNAGISNVADTYQTSLDALAGGFIVLASDGIWASLDSEGRTSAQRSEVRRQPTPTAEPAAGTSCTH